jgi:hypothetical protein
MTKSARRVLLRAFLASLCAAVGACFSAAVSPGSQPERKNAMRANEQTNSEGGAAEPERSPFILSADELRARIPKEHPRIFLLEEDWARLAARIREPAFRECCEPILKRADEAVAKPLPDFYFPRDFYNPALGPWDSRYALSIEGIRENGAMSKPVGEAMSAARSCAFAYRLTGKAAYRDKAKEAIAALAGLDLTATGYANTHGFHGVIPALAVALDYLWDDLTPEERDAAVKALLGRTREFYKLGNPMDNPRHPHSYIYGPTALVFASLALFHHADDAPVWMRDVMRYIVTQWPSVAGQDGGFCDGFGYGEHWAMHGAMQAMRAATGVNFFDLPWFRDNGKFFLYFHPPNSRCPGFGDAGYNRPKGLHRQMMLVYALATRDPYYQWYAEQISAPFYGGYEGLLSILLDAQEPPPAKAPRDLPQAAHMWDIGWVAMHSNLADGDNDVMLEFKSSRFGSAGHSHPDQNSFILEAFGQPLLIDSGYYPWMGSPHDLAWTRQTIAHDTLLFNGKGQGSGLTQASGRIIAFSTSADFDYAAGDAAEAYHCEAWNDIMPEYYANYEGVVRFVRHIVFVRPVEQPAAFVILDDVETEKPASVQFLLHALNKFDIDEAKRTLSVANGSAYARVHFLDSEPLEISQTDQFTRPPEFENMPNQWHVTCSHAPAAGTRRFLAVIGVGRSDETDALPPVERLDEPGIVGVRVGNAEVRFRFSAAQVVTSCRRVKKDGTRTWLEASAPAQSGGESEYRWLRDWMVIGPFPLEMVKQSDDVIPPGFLRRYPPERELNLTAEYEGMAGPVKWLAAEADSKGRVNLRRWISPCDNAVAYAAAKVTAPKQVETTLGLGTNDGARVWLNNKLVYSKHTGRRAAPNEQLLPVTLRAGENHLLLKIENWGATWDFYLSVRDPKGVLRLNQG